MAELSGPRIRGPLVLTLWLCLGPAAAAPAASYEKPVRDCVRDGRLERPYGERTLRRALDELDADVDEYTSCRLVMRQALRQGGLVLGGLVVDRGRTTVRLACPRRRKALRGVVRLRLRSRGRADRAFTCPPGATAVTRTVALNRAGRRVLARERTARARLRVTLPVASVVAAARLRTR